MHRNFGLTHYFFIRNLFFTKIAFLVIFFYKNLPKP